MKYDVVAATAKTLANGNVAAPGAVVTLTDEEAAQHDNAWLIADGHLVAAPEPQAEPELDADADEEMESEPEPEPEPKKGKAKGKATDTGGTDQ